MTVALRIQRDDYDVLHDGEIARRIYRKEAQSQAKHSAKSPHSKQSCGFRTVRPTYSENGELFPIFGVDPEGGNCDLFSRRWCAASQSVRARRRDAFGH
jgi:hypothetical protein